MDEEMKKQNLKNIETFFDCDIKIKNLLIKSAPNAIDKYDEIGKMDYYEKLDDKLKDMDFYFKKIIEIYFTEYKEEILEKINTIREKAFSSNDLDGNYQKYFSNMNEELIDNVKRNLHGHTYRRDVSGLINKSTTINELLHVMHSYIMNNEEILQSLPITEQKAIPNNKLARVNLYGEENEISKKIFENYKIDPSFGEVDIVSLKDRILMMVKDKGHALSIEINMMQEDALVNYFIPKICNIEKVNRLKGINRVKEDANIVTDSATGQFQVKKDQIVNEILDFIEKVPDDVDMITKPSWGKKNVVEEPIEEINEIEEAFFKDEDFFENGENNIENQERGLTVVNERKGIFRWVKNLFNNIKNRLNKKEIRREEKQEMKLDDNIEIESKKKSFLKEITGNGEYRTEEFNEKLKRNNENEKVNKKDNLEKKELRYL